MSSHSKNESHNLLTDLCLQPSLKNRSKGTLCSQWLNKVFSGKRVTAALKKRRAVN